MEQKIIIIQIFLFFLMVPFGIFGLFRSIKLFRKSFNGKIIIEFPLSQKNATFEIKKDGTYSIWEKSHSAQLIPARKFKSKIQNNITKEEIIINPSGTGQSVNNGPVRRMQLFIFSAGAGNYEAEVSEDSVDSEPRDKYFIQIRESQKDHFILIGILLVIMSVGFIICSILSGIYADRLF